jgi:MFS family permease
MSEAAIALVLTVLLIPRFIGAMVFGLAADLCGKKWPFVVICGLLVVLGIVLGFCNTYS